MSPVAIAGSVFHRPKRKVVYRLVRSLYQFSRFLTVLKVRKLRWIGLLYYGIRMLKLVRSEATAREVSTVIRQTRVYLWSIHRPVLRRRLLENASTRIAGWLENFWR
jgi:hypothetical protein